MTCRKQGHRQRRPSSAEILPDNDTAFRSRDFAVFATKWGVRLRFRAVHQLSGNDIVQRNHLTVIVRWFTGCAVKIYPSKKIVLLKHGKTYRLKNFKVYLEMYSNHNYMHKLGYFRPWHT